MPDMPVTSPLGYLGMLSLLFGIFLILAGLRVFRIEQIKVEEGVKTWIVGIVLVVLGVVLLLPEIRRSLLPSPTATVAVSPSKATPLSPTDASVFPTDTPATHPPTNTAASEPTDMSLTGLWPIQVE